MSFISKLVRRDKCDIAVYLPGFKVTEEDFQEYSALFEGTDSDIYIPLWESAYTGERDILLDKTTLAVIKEYLAYEIFPDEGGQPADYIGFESDFLLYLIHSGRITQAREFYGRHFYFFAKELFTRVKNDAAGNLYKQSADCILSGLEVIKKELAAEPYNLEIHSAELPKCFRKVTPEEKSALLELKIVKTAGRGNCGGSCRINAHVQAGCVVELSQAEQEDPEVILPVPCAKGRGYRKTFLTSQRLRYPMVRIGERGEGKFRRISWQEAEDIIYTKLKETREKYGAGSRFVHYGSGESCYLRGDQLAKRLLAFDGGYLGHYNSYSCACAEIILPYIYGTFEATPSWDTHKSSKLIVLWGFNPAVTTYNTEVLQTLREIKESNIPVISIDPIYNDTAAIFADEWIPILPGTDGALAAAIAYVLITEELYDKQFIDRFCIGFDRDHMPEGCENEESFFDYILGKYDSIPKTPSWAETITGIEKEVIVNLARRLGTIKPAAILTGWGMQRQLSGEQQIRMLAALACLTGNVGIRGGSTGVRGMPRKHRNPAMPMPPNPYHAEIPSFLWTKAIINGEKMTAYEDSVRGKDKLESNIKLILNIAGNTLINQHGDINATAEILKDTSKCEFIVVSDLFMTPSAKFADLLLPAVSMFEEDYIVIPKSESNYILFGNKAIDPIFEARPEFEWLKTIAERMGIEDFSQGCETRKEWSKKLYDAIRPYEKELPVFEAFADNGGYFYKSGNSFVPFEEQRNDFEHHKFPTESGKIEIFSQRLLNRNGSERIAPIPKYEPHAEELEQVRKYPFRVIGAHTKRRWHSIGDNNAWLEAVEPHVVSINTEDANALGICEGDLVRVFNDKGEIHIKAHITDRIVRGVAWIPQGAWFSSDQDGNDVRGSINTLTSLTPTPIARGNSQHSVFAKIEPGDI